MMNQERPFLTLGPGTLVALAAVLLAAFPCFAQNQQPGDTARNSPPKAGDNQKAGQGVKGNAPDPGTSNDRLFYTLPDFLTVQEAGKLPPLSTREKFKVVARGSFDYVEYFWYGALAGVSQAEDSEPGYGQGASGYGQRYGAALADGTIENFMTGAVLPSLLRQDPRFYQSGEGTFWHRTGYAMSRIVITRTDSGREQFNFSEIIGSALSAGISTYSYHPRPDRTLANTASVWGSQIGYDTITLVVKEFWPDIRRRLKRSPPEDAAASLARLN